MLDTNNVQSHDINASEEVETVLLKEKFGLLDDVRLPL